MPTQASTLTLQPVNLKAMTQTLTKKETLDDRVEKALCVLADDVLTDVIDFACRLAKHRGSKALHRNDIRVAFEKRFKVKLATKTTQAQNQVQPGAI